MIDFILICFAVGVFYGGFWCGVTFETVGAMFQRAKDYAKSIL